MRKRSTPGDALEQRLRAIEDRLEILNLIASHPPSADTGADYYTVQVYTEDGVFDRGANLTGAKGNREIAAILTSPGHQAAIRGGLVSADPHAAPVGRARRGAQSRRVEGVSHPPRRRQSLGADPHRARLED